ncbi:unnamed protein product [Brachionus calyciflorus]|uniref:Uncharacterized protein n=1 Tax=Brachionus calyciflorus TaxID=104777 RepID=A0A813YF85_9BILA|nr:unnamed protein product [Brachionus calyciflorus]
MSQKKFNNKSTALEVIEGHDLTGYEVIVTGASSGIGVETARAFAHAGARVVLAARDMSRLKSVADDIIKSSGNQKIEIEQLELNSIAKVNDFVKRYLSKNRPLNILVNNAAAMGQPLTYTSDGFELHFGTNHLGHFALTLGLIPALKLGHDLIGKKSRVISVSSMAHVFSDVTFEDPNFKNRKYDPWLAYGQSKTANILFSVGLTKLYSEHGIVSNALMPGGILTPGTLSVLENLTDEQKVKMRVTDEAGNDNQELKTIEQGASTSVWAAVATELEGKGGFYLENCGYSEMKESFDDVRTSFKGYLKYAVDEDRALQLWNLSLKWINQNSN